MKICILAMFGLLALANSAPQPDLEPKRHDNTKEKREANPQPTKEADSYGEPRRAYAYADPGYEQPAYRTKEARYLKEEHLYGEPGAYADPSYEQHAYSNGYGYAKRSAPDSSSDPYSQDPYLPAEHRQVGILQPAKRSAPDSSNDPNLPAEHRQVGILQPAKRSAPDASDYGVGYGDIWDMATPAVYDYQMQYKYDDGPQRRFTRDVKAAYARHVAKSKNLGGQVVRGNGDGPPSRVDRVN